MKAENHNTILIIALIITIIGFVTNKFLFLLLLFPFGINFFNKKNDNK